MKEEDLQLPLKIVAQDVTTPGLVWVFDSKENATRYRFHENHAEEIIRAVNSHAALVSALEGIVALQDSVDPEGLFEGAEMAKCRAALAFVKAQQ